LAVFYIIFAFGIFVLVGTLCGEPSTISIDDAISSLRTWVEAYAQTTDNNNTNSATSSNSEDADSAVVIQDDKAIATTFSAIGQISSLVITVPESGFNITNAFKVVLTGEWNLNVNEGNLTEFAVSFLASPVDGSRPHLHQITDFRPYHDDDADNSEESIIITLREDNSLSVNGTADIKINGILVWDDADVSISILKGNTFIFDPDDVDTENHFGDQQVYGIVTRLIT
jgi:hypothetical protein